MRGKLDFKRLLLVAAVLLAGCSGAKNGKVTGKITRKDGAPAAGIRVTARAETGVGWARATTDDEGRYELEAADPSEGIVPGKYTIALTEDLGDIDQRKRPTIAAKYGDPVTSGVTVTIVQGETAVLDISLDPR